MPYNLSIMVSLNCKKVTCKVLQNCNIWLALCIQRFLKEDFKTSYAKMTLIREGRLLKCAVWFWTLKKSRVIYLVVKEFNTVMKTLQLQGGGTGSKIVNICQCNSKFIPFLKYLMLCMISYFYKVTRLNGYCNNFSTTLWTKILKQ